ncbi:MAG: hypothetical protein IPM69_03710 [Ignavibacteria bacterium]|nr:hypothetical protein [Ignavibacteria bacterium]
MKILYSLLTFVLISYTGLSQPSVWNSTGIGAGGALYSPSVNPSSPNEIYVASASGSMYRTIDMATNWQTVNFRTMQTSDYIVSKVQFTINTNILYVLATDPETGFSLPMKSNDAGASWLPLAFDPTDGGGITMIVDYTNPDRIVISDYSTIYLSTDGGQNFTNKYDDATGAGCHLAGAFFDGNSIYIGTNAGVLSSTNNGASFSLMSLGNMPIEEAIVSFSGAKQGTTTRFYVITLDEFDVYPGVTGAQFGGFLGLYTLDVGSSNWSYKVTGISGSDFPFYVATSAGNINVAYAAGSGDKGTPMVYKTTNGGQSWTKTFNTTLNAGIATAWQGHLGDRDWTYGQYVTGIDVSRTDPNQLVLTDLGGIYISSNGSTSWRQAYVNILGQNAASQATPTRKYYKGVGLENSRIWNVAWADSVNILAGCSDLKTIASNDAGLSWSFNYTGIAQNNVYYTLKHPTSGTLYSATSNVTDLYQGTCLTDDIIDAPTATGQVMYSNDKGRTWLLAHNFGHPVVWLAADPLNPNRLYASVASSAFGGVYVTNNINAGAASIWTRLAAPPRTQGHAFNINVLKDGSLVCSYSARRAGSPLAFTQSSGVFISTDGGSSWIDRSDANLHYWTKDIVIDPHDATQNTWYATSYSGYGADGSSSKKGGLYRTNDRGLTWTKIAAIDRVSSCTVNPLAPNEMYVTTESEGLWYTSNLTTPTPVFSEVTGYPFRQPERVFFNPYKLNEIWVTSVGNGIRIGTGILPTAPAAPTLASPANDSTGVPTTRFLFWNITPSAANYHVQLSTVADFTTTIKDTTLSAPNYKFNGLTENTKYYWRVAGSNLVGTGAWSAVWNFTTVNNVQMPLAPGLLSPANDTIGAFTSRSLYWLAVAGAETYHVQLSQDVNFATTIIDQTGILNPAFSYTGLAQGAKYYWRVRAVNTAGTGAWSAVWNFTTKTAIGVDELQAITGMWLECTPNPILSGAVISFTLPLASDVRMVIADILGNEVMTVLNSTNIAGTHTIPIELPVTNGTYWIRLHTAFGIMTRQIQIMR